MSKEGGTSPERDADDVGPEPRSAARRRVLAWVVIVVVIGGAVALSVIQGDREGSDQAGGSSATPASTSARPGEPSTPIPPTTPGPTSPGGPAPSETTMVPTTLPPVALDETADFGDGITASLTDLVAIDGQAQGVGEIGGPAIRVSISLENGTQGAVSLDEVTVNLYFTTEQTPAVELSDPAMDPFEGSVEPGESASGVYVFSVPLESRDLITLTVTDSPGSPIVVFSGPLN